MADYFCGTGGSDSNGGTSHADRWLTVQHALNTMVPGPNNLYCTGSDTLAAPLDFTVYGSPVNYDNQLTLKGYTTEVDDGGIFNLNGGGGAFITDSINISYLNLTGLKLSNWGSAEAFHLDNYCSFIANEFDGSGSTGKIFDGDQYNTFMFNKFSNINPPTAQSITFSNLSPYFAFNYFAASNAANGAVILGISNNARGAVVEHNVFDIRMTLDGNFDDIASVVQITGDEQVVRNNTIKGQQPTRKPPLGIEFGSSGFSENSMVFNNLIVGFQTGIKVTNGPQRLLGFNAFYDCDATNEINAPLGFDWTANDVVLTEDPFLISGQADQNENDWTIGNQLDGKGFPFQLYNADGSFGDRNKTNQVMGAMYPALGGTVSSGFRRVRQFGGGFPE